MITRSLAAFLVANANIMAVCKEVRPVRLLDGHCDPALVYSQTDKTHEKDASGAVTSLKLASIELDHYSSSYELAHQQADVVRTEMETYTGAFGAHTAEQIDFDSEADAFDATAQLYVVSHTITIWYH